MNDSVSGPMHRNRQRVVVDLSMSPFRLPPVDSALVLGRRAPIGSKAMAKALEEMLPNTFAAIEVEHELIEALIVRRSDLRRIPQDKLVHKLISEAGPIMDASDTLHVSMDFTFHSSSEIEL